MFLLQGVAGMVAVTPTVLSLLAVWSSQEDVQGMACETYVRHVWHRRQLFADTADCFINLFAICHLLGELAS